MRLILPLLASRTRHFFGVLNKFFGEQRAHKLLVGHVASLLF